ncbi:unnamed protein product [Closterium sp. NIES-65]|nr:unnamed protein product [Closterium sp. NIES-65]
MSRSMSRFPFIVSSPTALHRYPPSKLFLAPGPPPVDPLPPQGPAPSGVSQVDALELVEVAVDSDAATGGGAAGGAEPERAEPGGSEPERVEPGGAEPDRVKCGGVEPKIAESEGAEPVGAEPGGAKCEGAEPGGAEPGGAVPGSAEPDVAETGGVESTGVPAGASSRREPLSPPQLREWLARRWRLQRGAAGAGAAGDPAGARVAGGTAGAGAAGGAGAPVAAGAAGAGAAGGTAGARPAGGARAAGPGGAHTGGTGAAGAGGAAGVGAGGASVVAAGGAPGAGTTGGARAGGVAGVGAGDPGAGRTGAVSAGSGGATRPRPYFFPLLQQVLDLPPSTGPTLPLLCPQPAQPQSQLEPASPLPCPSPYSRLTRDGTLSFHCSTARPSAVSSLADGPDPESDSFRAASPTVTRLLASVVSDPLFESTAASPLVAELVDFAAACRLDYAASLVAESESKFVCPPSVGGECALSTDVLEDRQEDFECFAAALPHLVSMLIAPEGDQDAPDIPTPRSYAEAIEGPYSSQWQTAMDVEMASWKFTRTYVDQVPSPGANIVSGMWIFRVKRPPGSPPVFKARYVAQGFGQREGVDFFQTFSPTPKMTTLWVLLHIAAQRDYELHSLDFSTAFLQGSLHEEIWLRRPPGFIGSFTPGTQWSLRRPVYGLRQAL